MGWVECGRPGWPGGPPGQVSSPYLRGYGTTRFLSDSTFRNGQQSTLS